MLGRFGIERPIPPIHRPCWTSRYRRHVLRRGEPDPIEQRFQRLERRLEDTEDALAASLSVDRIDELQQRVEVLGVTATTTDDLLQVRMDVARLAAEITRVRAELHAELDQVTSALLDIADPGYRRRAPG
jgi:hypothetical protein